MRDKIQDKLVSEENTRNFEETVPNEGSLAKPSAHPSAQGEPPYIQEMDGTNMNHLDSMGQTQNLTMQLQVANSMQHSQQSPMRPPHGMMMRNSWQNSNPPAQPETIEECWNTHPSELLYACLGTVNDNYVEANVGIPQHILNLIDMTSSLIDQNLAGEIAEKYFQEGKQQF
jgi:hypothetical protein